MTETTKDKLEPLSEQEIEDLKRRNPQTEPLTPRQWEQLKRTSYRPDYTET